MDVLSLVRLVQWLRLLTLISADVVQFLAKSAVFFIVFLSKFLLTFLQLPLNAFNNTHIPAHCFTVWGGHNSKLRRSD